MNREPQPMPEIILEDYSFISVRHWEGLTTGWPPSGGDAVRKHACLHQSLELCFPRAQRHPLFSSRLAPAPAFFGLAFFGFTALLFSAISQIWMGTGIGSMRGCESENVRAEDEDGMAKWRRYERGMRRHNYKALSPPFRIRGFLGNRSYNLCPSEFSDAA